jgi:hypothetical protein
MRAIVLVAAVFVQIVAGFGLMRVLDNFLDGGKISFTHWVGEEQTQQPTEAVHLLNLKEQPFEPNEHTKKHLVVRRGVNGEKNC